jgi:hypothetical protein
MAVFLPGSVPDRKTMDQQKASAQHSRNCGIPEALLVRVISGLFLFTSFHERIDVDHAPSCPADW